MKFYLIDDDRNILNVLKRIITDRGLGTICGCAQNGRDGLEDFEREKPDIVIVDVLMPEMDGISLVQKAKPLLPNTAFIMLSQVSSKDMIASAYEAGAETCQQCGGGKCDPESSGFFKYAADHAESTEYFYDRYECAYGRKLGSNRKRFDQPGSGSFY